MSLSGRERRDAAERNALDEVRSRFEKLGYQFEPQPQASVLPAFMAGWRPDAIAVRGDDHIAIEIKQAADHLTDRLTALQSRFENQPQWRLAVVTGGTDPAESGPIPMPEIDAIRRAAQDLRSLLDQEQRAAALVMSFALLEATSRIVIDQTNETPQRLDSIVQALAIEGLLDPVDEHRLQSLIRLRNRIVHGDLGTQVSSEDARAVASAVEKVIAAAFAA